MGKVKEGLGDRTKSHHVIAELTIKTPGHPWHLPHQS